MKITGFNPTIITSDYENSIKIFEALGFKVTHQKDGIEGLIEASTRMKNPDGFVIDVNKSDKFPRDVSLLRINVDNLDEYYQLFMDKGFKNVMGDGFIIEEPYFRGAHLVSPSGFGIMLMQHIKK
jgi:hypothetical protein